MPIMKKPFQLLKLFLSVYLFTLNSCKPADTVNTKNVFESATKSDSLTYYFPAIINDSFERRDPNFKDFHQNWYGSNLYAFKEPILFKKTDSQTIYRLLWLRSFRKPVCFTMKVFKGNYFLNAKTLDRQPAFYPEIVHKGVDENGKYIIDTTQKADRFALIDFDSIKVLSNREWKEIESYISNIDFWNIPISKPLEMVKDGSEWVLEGRKNGSYHFIKRQNAYGELMNLGKYLNNLSGLKIKENAIF